MYNMGTFDFLKAVSLNAVLYYADYLSLYHTSLPVTDTCKYFIIYGAPINAAYINGGSPIYNEENQYYKQAIEELHKIQEKTGRSGMISFLQNICNVFARGCVSGMQMLDCILYYKTKREKREARNKYNEYMSNIQYDLQYNEDGELTTAKCTKYVKHAGIKPNYDDCEKINRIFKGPLDD